MNKSIKNIINEYNDLHYISIKKPTRDRNTWTFEVHDKTSRLNGVCSKLIDYKYRIITLQRGDHFFIAYKLFFDDGRIAELFTFSEICFTVEGLRC